MPKPTTRPKFKVGDTVYCSTAEGIANPIGNTQLLSLKKSPPLRIDAVMHMIDGKPVSGSVKHSDGRNQFVPSGNSPLGPYYYLCKDTTLGAHHLVFEQALSTAAVCFGYP